MKTPAVWGHLESCRQRIGKVGAMEFAILGPLRVGGPAGAIELRAPKQRALLAMLLLSTARTRSPAAG